MSKPKRDWMGHNCVACLALPGKRSVKLARMTCQAWKGNKAGHMCGRHVCNLHGHKVHKMTVCNDCQPVVIALIQAPKVEQLSIFDELAASA